MPLPAGARPAGRTPREADTALPSESLERAIPGPLRSGPDLDALEVGVDQGHLPRMKLPDVTDEA